MKCRTELLAAVLLVALTGCPGSACDPNRVCEPRERKMCECPGDYQESHACNLSGTGWEDCPCVLNAPCEVGDDCGAHASCDERSETCRCDEGYHGCSGVCLSDWSVDHCGSSCSPCPTDPNGETRCDGDRCQLDCDTGFLACGGRCAECTDDPNGVPICDGALCSTSCNSGYRLCGDRCVTCPDGDQRFVECAGSQCLLAEVAVTGALVRENSSSAVGAPVTLVVDSQELASATTDSGGGYSFTVSAAQILDAESGAPVQIGVRGRLGLDHGEAEVGHDFTPQRTAVTVPTLKFLEATPMHTVTTDVAVTIPNWRDADGQAPAAFALRATNAAGEELADVRVSSGSSVVRISTALLEDFATQLRLRAVLAESAGGTTFAGYSAQAPFELDPLAPAPLSRGASCTYTHLSDQTGVELQPCPLADGDLTSGLDPGGPICVDPDPTDAIDECATAWEEAVLDLGDVQGLQRVAVHRLGDGISVVVAVSEDGAAFTNVGVLERASSAIDAPVSARYLQLSAEGPGTESRLATINEIAVY